MTNCKGVENFTPRLTRPEAGNPYYNTKGNGGYSSAIKGKPTDSGCDVLSNCVGYAYGRFNEIGGYGYCKYLRPVNAENFIQYKGDLEVGMEPRLGACMVWRKGATLSGSDGAGHVAIVEKVVSNSEVVTSESGWGSSTPFWTKTRRKGTDGRWGSGSAYTFLGFIYNPAVKDVAPKPIEPTPSVDIKVGDVVSIADGAIYYGMSKVVPTWVRKKKWIVKYVAGSRVVIDKSTDGKNSINSPIDVKYLTVLNSDGTKEPETPTKKSNEEIAKEVIRGKWGNGSERKRRLTEAGYNYRAVQDIVNQLLK